MIWICGIVLTILCIFHVEAQSLTCANTTGACPGAEVTLCTCNISSIALRWTLPGGEISLGGQDNVGDERTSGVYTVVVTSDTGGRESVLAYTATDTLMNADIQCVDLNSANPAATDTVTVTFAELPNAPSSITLINETSTYDNATIVWTEPSDNGGSDITGYNITISPSTSDGSTCPLGSCNVSSDTLMYNITELNHTIDYTISVAAINCIGTGDGASVLVDIVATVPNSIRALTAMALRTENNDLIYIQVNWTCPSFNRFSPPIDNYIIQGDIDTVIVDDDGCTYSEVVNTSIGDGEYTIQVLANNAIGQSTKNPSTDTVSITLLRCTPTATNDSVTFNCISSIDNARYSITLNPGNMVNSTMIGMSLSFSSLNATTEYTYTAMLTEPGDISYSITGSITTLNDTIPSTPTATASSSAPPTSRSTVSSSTPDATESPTADGSSIALIAGVAGGVGGGVCVAVVVAIILGACICCVCKKPRSKGEDGLTLSEYKPKRDDPEAYIERDPVPETGQSGPMYQDPNTIERQQAPTGDFYALPEKRTTGSRRQPPAAPTELATYQDPSTIQHETAPTGALYAMPDKKPAGIAKQDDRMYAALEFENGTGSASTSFQQGKPRPPDVLYSEVQQQP